MNPDRIINVHTHLKHRQNIAERIKLWHDCNVVKTCIQVIPLEGYYTNEEMVKIIAEYAEMIMVFGHIDLGSDLNTQKTDFIPKIDQPDKIDRLKEQGFAGLKLTAPQYAYDDEIYFPLYERAEALAMPILFHTGNLAPNPNYSQKLTSQNKMRCIYLDSIGRAFPKLKMIMGHLGHPEYNIGLDIIYTFKNIYGELSGHSGSQWRETELRKLFAPLPGADMSNPLENQALKLFEKICFGTDNPEPPVWIELSQRLMDELELPPELQERYWWENAATILDLDN
ncbi:MAG: amidohydrolase family protein [Victivallaceae bacterium]|nr:amidohydrolase family protein [Victivallaceae bacterium]